MAHLIVDLIYCSLAGWCVGTTFGRTYFMRKYHKEEMDYLEWWNFFVSGAAFVFMFIRIFI